MDTSAGGEVRLCKSNQGLSDRRGGEGGWLCAGLDLLILENSGHSQTSLLQAISKDVPLPILAFNCYS